MTPERPLDTDIEVLDVRTTFSPISLDHAFTISGRAIAWFTLAVVDVDVQNRLGAVATGRGASILSVPWAWPRSGLSIEQRDEILRGLTDRLAEQVCARPPTDPIRHWLDTHGSLPETAAQAASASGGDEHVPPLAAMLADGAVDNALHDGWAWAAGRPAHTMYTGRYLHDDLGRALGPELTGRWPGDFLTTPRSRLPVQHVVGADDPLEPADATDGERSVREWLAADGVHHVKVKVHARDADEDARRVAAIHRIGRDLDLDLTLAVDPNEGYGRAEDVTGLLDLLERHDAHAYRAVGYVEQPVPRHSTPDPEALAAAGARVPVLMDEGFVDPRSVAGLRAAGWSGIVIKAAKGHTAALLAHAAAKTAGMYVTVQDLTAVDLAFRHSARLVSLLDLSSVHLEYNSRQYAPGANDPLRATCPELGTVRDGAVIAPDPADPGLY